MIEVNDHSDEFMADLYRALDAGLRDASLEGSEIAASSMPGRGASNGQTKHSYRPSFPGQPPGVRTGRGKGDVTNARIQRLVWGYGTRVFYLRIHELGEGRHPARPFLRPSLIKGRVQIEDAFARTAARELARGVTRRAS